MLEAWVTCVGVIGQMDLFFWRLRHPCFICWQKSPKLSTHCFLDCEKRWPPWVGLSLLWCSNLEPQNFIVHQVTCRKNNAFCFHMQVNQRWRWKKRKHTQIVISTFEIFDFSEFFKNRYSSFLILELYSTPEICSKPLVFSGIVK